MTAVSQRPSPGASGVDQPGDQGDSRPTRVSSRVTVVPLSFLLVMTTWAMVINMIGYWTSETWLLFGVGGLIFVLVLWLVFEALAAIRMAIAAGGPGAPARHGS